jgi:hypothetical protein
MTCKGYVKKHYHFLGEIEEANKNFSQDDQCPI